MRRAAILILFFVFVLAPIYWMVKLAFQDTVTIATTYTILPVDFTTENFAKITTQSIWYNSYLNALIYVCLNTALSVIAALPAAYAFSRFKFLGDKHIFFWLLTNRMAPPAVFLLPFFQLYSSVNLLDTHVAVALAHCLFNVPLAVWILEGFMSGVSKEIDETAYVDGYTWPHFFITVFLPLIRSGVVVTAFFCFMFSWTEMLIATTLTSVKASPFSSVMTSTISSAGVDWGLLSAAGVVAIIPGAVVLFLVRHQIVRGFAMGRV